MNTIIKKTINFLHQKKIDRLCEKKINKIKKHISNIYIHKDLEEEYMRLWMKFGRKPSLTFQRCMCALSGINSSKYVPENLHYGVIEPILNNRAYSLTYNDKNFLERYLINYKDLFPTAILRGIHGVFYDPYFSYADEKEAKHILSELQEEEVLVLKPASETGGGENVVLVQKVQNAFYINKMKYSLSEFIKLLKKSYSKSFLLQSKIKQHEWLERFNKTSLNTIRIYTYRSIADEKINHLHAYIRFGRLGSVVDSSSQGGRTCGVSSQGHLNDFALGKYGEKYHDLDCIKICKKTSVPYFNSMKNFALEIGSFFNNHRLLGFDFTLDENNNIKLLEVNNLYIGIINQQMNSGPLFGQFTEEVIDYCLSHKKSVFFHFYM